MAHETPRAAIASATQGVPFRLWRRPPELSTKTHSVGCPSTNEGKSSPSRRNPRPERQNLESRSKCPQEILSHRPLPPPHPPFASAHTAHRVAAGPGQALPTRLGRLRAGALRKRDDTPLRPHAASCMRPGKSARLNEAPPGFHRQRHNAKKPPGGDTLQPGGVTCTLHAVAAKPRQARLSVLSGWASLPHRGAR